MKLFNFILLSFIIFSCKNNSVDSVFTSTIKNKNMYVIDLDNAEQMDSFKLSFFVKSAKCIRLEESTKSIIGEINKLIVFNDYLFVADIDYAKGLFVFDMEGKFVRKIGERGRGPGEYIGFFDFTIDMDNHEIILLDHTQIHFYDLEGNYLKSVQTRSDGLITNIQYFNGLIYSDIIAFKKTKNDYLLQSFETVNGQRKNSFLNTGIHNKGLNVPIMFEMKYFIPKLEPPYLFRHSFMDTIFSITNDGLSPYLVLKSKDLVTKNDLKYPENTNLHDFLNNNLEKKNKIYILSNYLESSDYLHFRFLKGSDSKFVFFNKNSGKAQISEHFINDIVYRGQLPRLWPRFLFYDQNGAYETIKYFRLENFLLPLMTDKKELLQQPFNELLADLNEESNPVIFYYEFY